jgi:hypothetical protein
MDTYACSDAWFKFQSKLKLREGFSSICNFEIVKRIGMNHFSIEKGALQNRK